MRVWRYSILLFLIFAEFTFDEAAGYADGSSGGSGDAGDDATDGYRISRLRQLLRLLRWLLRWGERDDFLGKVIRISA